MAARGRDRRAETKPIADLSHNMMELRRCRAAPALAHRKDGRRQIADSCRFGVNPA
jgi:hypothetical protein